MDVLRYLITLVIVAFVLTIAVLNAAPARPARLRAEVIGIMSPRLVASEERYWVFGGLVLPAGTYGKRFRICGETGCRLAGWGNVEGPGEWWGFVGHLLVEPGVYQVELLLVKELEDDVRTLARYGWEVEAY